MPSDRRPDITQSPGEMVAEALRLLCEELLVSQGIVRGDEQLAGVEKVLGAAAWTYVAAAVSAIGVFPFYVFVLFFRGIPMG